MITYFPFVLSKNKLDKKTQAYFNLIDRSKEIHITMVNLLSGYLDLIKKKDYGSLKGELLVFLENTSLMESMLKLYMTQYVSLFYKDYEINSLKEDEIKNDYEKIMVWLSNIKYYRDNLINSIDIHDDNKISKSYLSFQKIILAHDDLIRITNHLRTITLEYLMLQKDDMIDKNDYIFMINRLKINKRIYKNCLSLFKKDEYDKAVFESLKIMENYIKEISNIKDTYGDDLINKTLNITSPLIQSLDKDEQTNVYFLAKGIIPIRNILAHEPNIKMTKEEAIKYIVIISRILDMIDKRKK